MRLSPQQLKTFDEDGYLFLPDCFSDAEVAALRHEAEALFRVERPEVWREKSGAPRTAFAAHLYNEGFRLLGAHPRLIEPVEQLFGEQLYMHQYKVNAKAAFDGDVWQWHQDYGVWSRDDGMPEPRAMNISVFLDEVMAINGPLMFIPGSHKAGVLPAGHDEATTSYPLWTLDHATISRLVDAAAPRGGIVAPVGKPGAVLMFHGNLVHASTANITPYPRKIVYLTLCALSNYIRTPTRPEWIAHRDFTPIVPVADDALLHYARAHPHPGPPPPAGEGEGSSGGASLPRKRERVRVGVAAQ
ncbi:MAG TPA: phytanoyl-CoA dioxygenase family protein [Stellaceae bacterium]|nr:phytanoyl-CoA dioxygenase family protein [Stellaceae bacterium]